MIDNRHNAQGGKYNSFSRGMVMDSSENRQPEETYRYGLNGVRGTLQGDRTNKANEPGNTECWRLPDNFYQIGSEYFDNFIAIFAVSIDGKESLIGKAYPMDCKFEEVVRSKCLNFNINNQIQSIGRVRLGCEDTLYWTDNLNDVRYFNFGSEKDFQTEAYTKYLLENKSPSAYQGEKWDCDKFSLFRSFRVGCISEADVVSGGQLKSGSYNFALRWLDEDSNPTPWFPTTNTVNVYKDYSKSASNYPAIMGSSNVETDTAGGIANSGKALELTITNVDTRFSHYQIAVVMAYSFTGKVTEIVVSPPIPISTTTYVIDGDFTSYTPGSIEELRIVGADIETAKTIAQMENRLVLGNISGKKYDVCGFQRYASKIATNYIVKEVPIDEVDNVGDSKNPNTLFTYGSHQGDEVAALGIVYVFEDGKESPVYHIPGMPANTWGYLPTEATVDTYCINFWPFVACGDENEFINEPVRITVDFTVDGVPKDASFYVEPGANIWQLYCQVGDFDFQIVNVDAQSTPNCKDVRIYNYGFEKVKYTEYVEVDGEESDPCKKITKSGQLVDDLQTEGWDTAIIQDWKDELSPIVPEINEDGVPYNVLPESEKLPRWKIENTAKKATATRGKLAYYECTNTTYPDIKDCSGKSIWGEDVCGNPLTGKKVRHHRMPDRSLEPLLAGGYSDNTENCLSMNVRKSGDWEVEVKYKVGTVNKTVTLKGKYPGVQIIECSAEPVFYLSHTAIKGANSDYNFSVQKLIAKGSPQRRARILGFEFSNVEYPSSEIVGHYFVAAIREDINKTVVDAGIVGKTREAKGNVGFSYFTKGSNYSSIVYYMTPEYLVNNKESSGDSIHLQGEFEFANKELRCQDLDGAGSAFSNVDTIVDVRRQVYGNYIPSDTKDKRPIKKLHNMNGISYKDAYFPSGKDLVNLSLTNRMQLLELNTGIVKDKENNLQYYYARRYKDVYCDLFGLTYRKLHNCTLTLSDKQIVYGGDTYITPMPVNNTLLRNIYDSYWDNALKVLVLLASTAITVATAGIAGVAITPFMATAIAIASTIGVGAVAYQAIKERYKARQYKELAKDTELNNGCSNSWFEDSFIAYANERLEGIYVESQINFGLRQEFVGECGSLYKGGDILEFFKGKILNFNEDSGKYQPKPVICPEIYWYNPDFSRVDMERLFLPIPRNYKCCSDCLEEHSNRVHWSQQSFQEERTDNYRTFLVNNYKDIDAQHGDITNITPHHERLLIMTEDGLWISVASLQERAAGDVITFIGTGQFLGVPERKAIDDIIGSVGCQHQFGVLKTRFGVFIPDEKENSLYLYGDGLKDLFVGRMKAWAQSNFKSFMVEALSKFQIRDFEKNDNPANPFGLGIHMTYDPFFRRVLITKRDYEPLFLTPWPLRGNPFGYTSEQLASFNLRKDTLYYYKSRFFVYIPPSGKVGPSDKYGGVAALREIPFTDYRYFRDRSFTLSYYPEGDEFGFFHSYIPLSYTRDKNTFYSSIDERSWKHNQPNMLSFYNYKKPFIIDAVDASESISDKYTDYIGFYTQAKRWTGDGYADADKVTFDKVVVYNSYQTTGVLNIAIPNPEDVLVQEVKEDTNTVFVDRRGKDFYINDLWNATNGQQSSLFRTDWASLQSQYPIDKVPNFDITNIIGQWDRLTPMMDKYVAYRFFFSGDDTLVLHYVIPGSYKTQL